MRPIKFRAWNERDKEMYFFDFKSFHESPAPIIIAIRMEVAPVMQFTGLHDKNGKEIWEGDIIAFKNNFMPKAKNLGFIKYDKGRAAYVTNNNLSDNEFGGTLFEQVDNGCCSDSENLEVIGNVWQNPELLNGGEC